MSSYYSTKLKSNLIIVMYFWKINIVKKLREERLMTDDMGQWYSFDSFSAYVKDSGYPSLYDTATVVIDVLDVNDHSPEFRDPVYRVEVAENTKMTVVQTVIATDKDSGENGQVSYSIIGKIERKLLQNGKVMC